MSVKATWTYSDLLQRYCIFIIFLPAFVTWNIFSKRTTCDECRCDLEKDGSPTDLIVYTRMGTKYFQHQNKKCQNRFCEKTFFYGYSSKRGMKKYEADILQGDYLVSSSQTAFSISYLYEITLQVLHSNANFQSLADIYTSLHAYNTHHQFRSDLNRQRVLDAWFLYAYLELSSRYGINPIFNGGETWLEDSINDNFNNLKDKFSVTWTNHRCKVPFCSEMMVTDGGFKINRPVCSAKFSVMREYKHSNKRVLTGCTSMPTPGSKFCSSHQNEDSPVILKENLTSNSRSQLYNFRSRTKQTQLDLPDDDLFVVESILEAKEQKKTKLFLVKWAGFPESESTWEPSRNIPQFISRYYADSSKFGKPLPEPRIKHTKKVSKNSEIFHYLEWGNESSSSGEWVSDNLFDLDSDKVIESVSSCNTRKVRDKRDRRHSCGILVSCKPCGICPHWDELFGSESITQVYGSIIEYYGNLPHNVREKIKIWFFDDMCHLSPHSANPKQAELNDITRQFAGIVKAVDNFHFKKGHKGKWCQLNANPNIEMKKVGMIHANTPVCEQFFSWVNKFRNIKSMNEAHFKLFLLYILDLHNLHIEQKVDIIANPLNPRRYEEIHIAAEEVAIEGLGKLSIGNESEAEETSSVTVGSSEVESKSAELDDCFSQMPNGDLLCNFCPGIFKRIGNLRNHLNSKHKMCIKLFCGCGKEFQDATKLSRHQKSCKQ